MQNNLVLPCSSGVYPYEAFLCSFQGLYEPTVVEYFSFSGEILQLDGDGHHDAILLGIGMVCLCYIIFFTLTQSEA